MLDINKIKPGDILYTIKEMWDDELDCNSGRISLVVKNVEPWLPDGRIGVLAEGRCWYSIENLTDEKPKGWSDYLQKDF